MRACVNLTIHKITTDNNWKLEEIRDGSRNTEERSREENHSFECLLLLYAHVLFHEEQFHEEQHALPAFQTVLSRKVSRESRQFLTDIMLKNLAKTLDVSQ